MDGWMGLKEKKNAKLNYSIKLLYFDYLEFLHIFVEKFLYIVLK